MKRMLVVLLCLVCALSLVGCGQTAPKTIEPEHPVHDDAVVPVEYRWGDYVNIAMELPEGWEWEAAEIADCDGEPPMTVGFSFWKSDEPDLCFRFLCWLQGFGMCGTGVDFTDVNGIHNLTLAEERGQDGICVDLIFNDVAGSYVVSGAIPTELWEEYRNTVVSMVDQSIIAQGCIAQAEAEDIARNAHPWLPADSDVYGSFDPCEGVWRLCFMPDPADKDGFESYVWVNNSGEIVNLTRDAEGQEPISWNEADGEVCGLPLQNAGN